VTPVLAAAAELEAFLRSQGWRFCVIGGLAVLRWGQPRTTQDVDVSLFVDLGDEEAYIDHVLSRFASRIPDAREFALTHRVLLLQASNGIPLDIALASFPFEEEIIARASSFELASGTVLTIVSCEDLLVFKSFSGRPQDWVDVEGILIRQRGEIGWPAVESNLAALCDLTESTDPLERLQELRCRYS
jgi:hypothetical protein